MGDENELILIITPTPVEFRAMRGKVTRPQNVKGDATSFRGRIGAADILCVSPGKGPAITSAVTTGLIKDWAPRYVFLVGVAGGLHRVAVGDLVVPTVVHDLDYGKVENGHFLRRKEYDWSPDYGLMQAATHLGEGDSGWKRGIKVPRPDRGSPMATEFHVGYFGSSSKVIDDLEYVAIVHALAAATEVLAVEMEGSGAAAAVRVAQSERKIGILMIRAISDLVTASKRDLGAGTKQRDDWKPYAATVAATFAAALIKELYPKEKLRVSLQPLVEGISLAPQAPSESLRGEKTQSSANKPARTVLSLFTHDVALLSKLARRIEREIRAFSPPPLVARLVRREDTVEALRAGVASRVWTALVGSRGSGKSHLALLLAATERTFWVESKDLSSAATLEDALSELASDATASDVYMAGCKGAGEGAMMVLDDLPGTSNAQMRVGLGRLARAAKEYGVRMLSISGNVPAAEVRHALGKGEFAAIPVPDFTENDAYELFRAYGSEEHLQEGEVKLLNTMARGNPTLLTAVAEFLASRDWQFSFDDLRAILSHAHLADIEKEVLQRLLGDVTDDVTRDLFYRLRVANRRLSFREIQWLAEIPPPIPAVMERLMSLEGLWIRRVASDAYEIAPLAEALPAHTLDADTERATHNAVGEIAIAKGTLTRQDVVDAVVHFAAAKELNRGGAILVLALTEINAQNAWHDDLLPKLWAHTALPTEIDFNLRLLIRLQQVKFFQATSAVPEFLLNDLCELVAGAATAEAGILAFIALEAAKPRRPQRGLWRVALRALQRLGVVAPKDGVLMAREEPLPEGTWLSTVFVVGRGASSVAEADEWMAAVDALPMSVGAEIRTSAEFDRSSLVNEWWLRVADESGPPEAWEEVLQRLDRLAEWAQLRGDELLSAYARRAQIVVAGEYVHNINRAIAVADEVMPLLKGAHARFLVAEGLAFQYAYIDRHGEAEIHFADAGTNVNAATSSEAVIFFLRSAQSVARRKTSDALWLLEQADDIARLNPDDVFSRQRDQAQAELGLAWWLNGDLPRAVTIWNELAERLLAEEPRTDELKGLLAVFHAVLAYPAVITRVGHAPIEEGGSQQMERPAVGTFNRNFNADASWYKPEQRNQIELSLAFLASDAANWILAEKWARRAHSNAKKRSDSRRLSLAALALLPFPLLENDFAEAVSLVCEDIRTWSDADRAAYTGPGKELANPSISLIIVRIARVALDDAAQARAFLRDVGERIEPGLETADREAFRRIRAAFDGGNGDLFAAILGSEDTPESVQTIARLLRSVVQNRGTGQRAADHVVMGPGMVKRAPLWGSGFHLIALDFFQTYWERELEANAFRFARPGDVRREVARLRESRDGSHLQMLLELVADGLGLTVPEPLRAWFRKAAGDH